MLRHIEPQAPPFDCRRVDHLTLFRVQAMEPVKNVQQQRTTTRLTRTCTRALVMLSSYPGSPGPRLRTTPFILRALKQRCCHDGWCAPVYDTQQTFHRLHSESTLACGSWRWGNTCGTCRPQPPPHTLSKEKTHFLTLLQQNHLDLPRSPQFVHVHPCCRLTPVRALQTTSPATSSTISSRICGTGTSTTCSTTRCCTRSRGTWCTPSRICGTGSATICSTTICSRLVTGHGTRGTQHHNVCYDVYRAPCESHDNLSEDVADASNQPIPRLIEVKERVSCKMCEIHEARLLKDCSPGAPPTPMTGLLRLSASLAGQLLVSGQGPACRQRHS